MIIEQCEENEVNMTCRYSYVLFSQQMSMCPEVTVALGLSTVGAPGSGHVHPL